jgi:hypothetical protein
MRRERQRRSAQLPACRIAQPGSSASFSNLGIRARRLPFPGKIADTLQQRLHLSIPSEQ